jgi:hypothetical protein
MQNLSHVILVSQFVVKAFLKLFRIFNSSVWLSKPVTALSINRLKLIVEMRIGATVTRKATLEALEYESVGKIHTLPPTRRIYTGRPLMNCG